ncbi:MAG: pentapeptide repeat-containing protein [Flavobacteriales bacterium]
MKGGTGAMRTEHIEDTMFDAQRTQGTGLEANEYTRCTFVGCDLKSSDLKGKVFVECTFRSCDLSLAGVSRTSWQGVRFEHCKLLGLRFDQCHTFLLELAFESCILDLASFHGLKLKNTVFGNCRLRETDLSGADLSGASFAGCDLGAAVFDRTLLDGADLRSAQHYSIDPAKNKIRKARFSKDGLEGLLHQSGIIISD